MPARHSRPRRSRRSRPRARRRARRRRPTTSAACSRGVIDPELHAEHRRPRHGRRRDRRRRRRASSSASRSPPPAARCGPRSSRTSSRRCAACPASPTVKVEYGEMTQEQKTAAMQRARLNARENAAPTEVAVDHAGARGRERQGRRRQVVGHREPRRRARGARAHASACSTPTSGASASRACSASTAASAATDGKIDAAHLDVPNADGGRRGTLKVVSMGFLVDDEGTALMWRGLILTKALEQFLTDVRWGELDYLLIDMPPGTGDVQMGLARMLPQAEMLVVTTPALAAQKVAIARRRHGAPLVHEGRRRGREHERVRRARRLALRGVRRAAAATRSPRRSARRSSRDPARARGVERRRHRRPVVLVAPDSPPGRAFPELAARASSTSCCRRSRWPAAPPASSTSSPRSSH